MNSNEYIELTNVCFPARLDAECQQLARDLQAAVRELVRPELSLGGARASNLGGSSSKVNGGSSSTRGKAMDEVHDYSEIYTPSAETPENCLPLGQPPPPPIHRYFLPVHSST